MTDSVIEVKLQEWGVSSSYKFLKGNPVFSTSDELFKKEQNEELRLSVKSELDYFFMIDLIEIMLIVVVVYWEDSVNKLVYVSVDKVDLKGS